MTIVRRAGKLFESPCSKERRGRDSLEFILLLLDPANPVIKSGNSSGRWGVERDARVAQASKQMETNEN